MTGGNAFDLMFFGHKVRLPEWEGYWFRKNGKLWVHLQDGTEIEQDNIIWINATVWRNDWEVVKE